MVTRSGSGAAGVTVAGTTVGVRIRPLLGAGGRKGTSSEVAAPTTRPYDVPRKVIRGGCPGDRTVGRHPVTPDGSSVISTRKRRAPRPTWSPAAAPTSVTVPANGALSASSIFIASIAP